MRHFTLYGLEGHEMLWCERFEATDVLAAARRGRDRLSMFPSIEIWEGPVCVLRLRREPLAARAPSEFTG